MQPQDEKNQLAEIAKRKAKKALNRKVKAVAKKAGKAVAKAAVHAVAAAIKSLLSFLAAIGLPYILIIGGIVLALFLIYLAVTFMFTTDSSVLDKEQKEFQSYIIAEADATVDMSKPEQVPYRVPHELIIAAMQIYDSTKHGQSDKEAVHTMAQALKPIFKYKELEGKIETEITTCTNGSCSTSNQQTPFPLIFLERVDAWDRIMTATFTPFTTQWQVSVSESTTYETVPKTDAQGKEIPGETDSKAVTTTVTTKTRAHTYIPHEIVVEDYTYFDRVLSDPPFNYGQDDKYMVEALYQATGGYIRYKEWLSGNSLIGFDGSVTPGSSVPLEYMKYYLEAEKIYKVDWYYLAAIHFIETTFSTLDPMLSSVGAEGHMQFMPCTWHGWSVPSCKGTNGNAPIPSDIKYNPLKIKEYRGYGVDANKNGTASPWEIEDAIHSTAHYLNSSGYSKNVDQALYAYNHADWYIKKVKDAAAKYKAEATYSPNPGSIPPLKPGSFMVPAAGPKSSGYGMRTLGGKTRLHAGVDISGQGKTDIPIVASADGVVSKVNTGCPEIGGINSTCGGEWGNHVFVKHTVDGQTYEAVYGHMSKVKVTLNQQVKQGELLGIMGRSGRSTGIHLHFEIHKNKRVNSKTSLNPELFISF